MKKLVLFIFVVFFAGAAFPQDIESHKPMGRFCYNILTKRIEGPDRDKRRMKKGVRIISRKHISSNQAYKLTLLFTEDEYRLGFVKGIYPSITDKSNAIVMLDGFEKFSYQTILWEYIQAENRKYGVEETDITSYQEFLDMRDRKRDRQYDKDEDKDLVVEEDVVEENTMSEHTEETDNNTETTETDSNDSQTEANENSTIFPDAAAYTGRKGCDDYLSEKPFLAFANTVAQFDNDKEKAIICMEYTEKYCFTTSQVMKLGVIIENEASRYVFFKTAKDKVYDKNNFHHVKQLLTNERFIEELD